MINRIGLFGGSFNPVHNMHISLAESFIIQLALDKCVVVPTNISPFKYENIADEKNNSHRLNMLKLAFADNLNILIDDFEIKKGGISFTIDTIKYLSASFNTKEIFLLIGSDQALEFERWKDWQEILNIVNVCIAIRPGSFQDFDKRKINHILSKNNRQPVFLDSTESDLSSNLIRHKVSIGESIAGMTSESVEKYIKENNLYK
jgi:nicotinate-nucleotide adenylyltransferase